MVICATGAVVTGLRYWMDHWQQAKNDLDDSKCSVVGGKCVCPTVSSAMPSSGRCKLENKLTGVFRTPSNTYDRVFLQK